MIGPNGAGKTTLLQILAGALAPTRRDRVAVARARGLGAAAARAVLEAVGRGEPAAVRAAREGPGRRRPRSSRMLEQTGLEDRADDELGQLSGGNRQRVNIAIGLLRSPAALLLDEPSAALDPRQRERLWSFIGGLAGGGTAVVYSTHDVGEAERFADRVLVLADGELLFSGQPDGARRRRPRLRVGLRRVPARAGALMRARRATAADREPGPG